MTDSREEFIDELTQDLTAVKPVNTVVSAVYWLTAAFFISLIILLIASPLREGALGQLFSSAHFFIESFIGVIAISMLIYSGFEMAIPSDKSYFQRVRWSLLAMLVWISFYVLGLIMPALVPSVMGKREFCYVETFIFALPALAIGLYWASKQWPAHPIITGGVIGIAAGSVPALLMQFACMYDPIHILQYHILPGLSVGLLGAIIGFFILKIR